MNYKLSEEQSVKFYEDLELIHDFAKKISTEALDLVRTYYGLYELEVEKHYFWKKKSFHWFLKTIGNDTGYEYVGPSCTSLGWEFITTRNNSGWVYKTKPERIAKLTGLDVNQVKNECAIIQKAAWYMFGNRAFMWKINNYLNDLRNYLTVPYTLDDEWMSTYKYLPEHIQYWKIEETK